MPKGIAHGLDGCYGLTRIFFTDLMSFAHTHLCAVRQRIVNIEVDQKQRSEHNIILQRRFRPSNKFEADSSSQLKRTNQRVRSDMIKAIMCQRIFLTYLVHLIQYHVCLPEILLSCSILSPKLYSLQKWMIRNREPVVLYLPRISQKCPIDQEATPVVERSIVS